MNAPPVFPPIFPLARNPGGPAPVRRANSVRRTSTIDSGWPDGAGQPTLMIGAARDIYTGPDGGSPEILAHDSFRARVSTEREILEIAVTPDRPGIERLVGVRAGGRSRSMLQELLPDDKANGTPLYLILDDFAGASLVSNWVWSLWVDDWHSKLAEMREAQGGDFRAHMVNICTGFAEGSSALNIDRRPPTDGQSEVPSLLHPDDPDGWHDFYDHPKVSMRRARWIDVWREEARVHIRAGFQDSGLNPKGGRSAVHEYRLLAVAEAGDFTLRSLDIDAHILPFAECPGAPPKAQAMVGQKLGDFRQAVLETLPGTTGCTHLNDVLRALAEVPHLAAMLPG